MANAAMIQDQRLGLLLPALSLAFLYQASRYGINADVLRKWVKDAKGSGSPATFSRSAFIPVVAADCSRPVRTRSLNMEVARGEDQTASLEKTAGLSGSSKIRALLPNGVKLSLECGDVDALTAIIGALCHVQTGR